MNAESVFQNIADEIFADRLSKNDDKSAAIGFIYSLLDLIGKGLGC